MSLSLSSASSPTLEAEACRRRTFAIISHPDAGKTTLTEKLLLYGGVLHEAGSVVAKSGQAHTASDWMSIEKQRGISVSSSALSFDYAGYRLNLLDTPGHQDFSEDTYRTLVAADSAVMLLDAARGVQAQTEKLFAVCRRRGIPIFTFINKLDRPALDPFELLAETERVLGITAIPLTWPIGDGPDFKGVYERASKSVHLFERTVRNAKPAPVRTSGVDDPLLKELLGETAHRKLQEDIELVEGLIEPFELARFLAGEVTPVFFGSVLTNFGVQEFLDRFIDYAPAPAALETSHGRLEPVSEGFTAFIFKLQANMNRHHRDRTAYARIAAGRFERGMNALHTRSGRPLKLSQAHMLFAQERRIVEEAYPGDIIGLVNPGVFRIGDVISTQADLTLLELPRFVPESFRLLRPKIADKRKAFRKGLEGLAEEGVVQVFYPTEGARDPVIGAVGVLQFEVFEHRMLEEYGVEIAMDALPYTLIRWLGGTSNGERFAYPLEDEAGRKALLFKSRWELDYFKEQQPDAELLDFPEP